MRIRRRILSDRSIFYVMFVQPIAQDVVHIDLVNDC